MTAAVNKTWAACPPGLLDGIVRRQRSRRRNALIREAVGMIVLVTSLGFTIGYFSIPGAKAPVPPQSFFAGISCIKVQELLPAMMKNELDATRAAQVREHVRLCPECRRLMEQMLANPAIARKIKDAYAPAVVDAEEGGGIAAQLPVRAVPTRS